MPDLRISRRALLKILAASSGSLAASGMLPGKWMKPALRVGVLPVHAQTSSSQKYQIVDSHVEYIGWYGCVRGLSATISPADDGVRMKAVLCFSDALDTIPCRTLYADTKAGVAVFTDTPDNPVLVCFGFSHLDITFTFANPGQDGSGRVKYFCDGDVCKIQ